MDPSGLFLAYLAVSLVLVYLVGGQLSRPGAVFLRDVSRASPTWPRPSAGCC